MTDPLGQSQVIPYLKGLAKLGYRVTLLSFEKKERMETQGDLLRGILKDASIEWVPKLFSRRPPLLSKLYDLWRLKKLARQLHSERKFDLIHCRSYLSAEAGLQLWNKHKVPFLFDMRGFWVDERVDNGQWKLGNPVYKAAYKIYKRKEKKFFASASHIISLTHRGKEELSTNYQVAANKITVIPCCVDTDHFDFSKVSLTDKESAMARLQIQADDKILTYLGSLGGWYLNNEMLDFFSVLKKKFNKLKFLFITFDDAEKIFAAASARGIARTDIIVQPATRKEVPLYLSLSNWSIFFIKNAYSKIASSPTKQGEIMSMGIPVICNDIGDTGFIVKTAASGMLVEQFNVDAFEQAAALVESLPKAPNAAIREQAKAFFDLQKGIADYASVYKKLIA